MMLGCPHDVAGGALLMHILAGRLGVKPGKYTHSISNAHIYDIHYNQAWEILERPDDHPLIFLEAQKDWFERAEKFDDTVVDEIVSKLNQNYKPGAPIKGMQIVL